MDQKSEEGRVLAEKVQQYQFIGFGFRFSRDIIGLNEVSSVFLGVFKL